MPTKLEEIQKRGQAVLCNTYGRYPVGVSRAEGCRLYGFDGEEYVDLLAGIAVANLGHGRPELAAIMEEQATKLVHVSNLFYQEEQIVLAEKLLATCEADKVFFCNSGAEANEAAIKLARRYQRHVRGTDAYEVVTLEGSFHGRTLATLTATGQAGPIKDGFDPLPAGFVTVPFDDACALRDAVTERTAAVLVEVVQGEGGVRPLSPEFLNAALESCRRVGALLMVDEVQTGLCRTGRFWAHQHTDVRPDVFTTAKALANGLPMGALLCTDEAAKAFTPGSHATTFGGGGLLSAVAARTIDIMRDEALAERAQDMGQWLRNRLLKLVERHPDKIAGVRVAGLMVGIELRFEGQEVWSALLERGFVLNLTQGRVLRLLPPLTIPRDDLEAFATALGEVLDARDCAPLPGGDQS